MKFVRKLHFDYNEDLVLQLFLKKLDQLNIDKKQLVSDKKIVFKNRFFTSKQGRMHLMATINKGSFELTENKNLIYRVHNLYAFIVSITISLFIGLISKSIMVSAGIFLWLYFIGCVISYFRHLHFINKFVKRIADISKPQTGASLRASKAGS